MEQVTPPESGAVELFDLPPVGVAVLARIVVA